MNVLIAIAGEKGNKRALKRNKCINQRTKSTQTNEQKELEKKRERKRNRLMKTRRSREEGKRNNKWRAHSWKSISVIIYNPVRSWIDVSIQHPSQGFVSLPCSLSLSLCVCFCVSFFTVPLAFPFPLLCALPICWVTRLPSFVIILSRPIVFFLTRLSALAEALLVIPSWTCSTQLSTVLTAASYFVRAWRTTRRRGRGRREDDDELCWCYWWWWRWKVNKTKKKARNMNWDRDRPTRTTTELLGEERKIPNTNRQQKKTSNERKEYQKWRVGSNAREKATNT